MSIAGISAGSAQLNTTLQALQALGVSGLPSSGGGDSQLAPSDIVALSESASQLQTVTALLTAQFRPSQNGTHVNVLG